ncbi:uncharacterized protein PV09_06094 [Verruconis gallopava]|uniref:Uncharacterized protein n=1 Tax=Verruconis gallopava TaxID=253628 RepID=A0A0D1XK11_9PEZI|nr:uncharacterized protein PV09_06094 [Verruconis gallopava]KIW02656.1 hypothetical protein PV09_06094 [Verruconis gallopava]
MSSQQNWSEEDYPSSGDELRNDRVRRNRERITARNVERVRAVVSEPPTREVSGRAYVAALNTIREDPSIRAQLQRIEEVWTVKRDKVLADVLYTEVTLAIVQAANAIAKAGRNWAGEDEEHFAALQSARSRTVGNFQWAEPANTPTDARQRDLDDTSRKRLSQA